jgi:hypothetical protein
MISPALDPTIDDPLGAEPLALDITIDDSLDPLEGLEVSLDGEEDPSDECCDVQLQPHDSNLAEVLTAKQKDKLIDLLIGRIDSDNESRQLWIDTVATGYKLLGLSIEERSTPFQGACGAHSTLMIETLTRFVAEVGAETWPAAGPARVAVKTMAPDVRAASVRVEDRLNTYLSTDNRSARSEHEKALFHCGLSGSAFKKIYASGTKREPVIEYVPADHVILPSGSSDLRSAPYFVHCLRMFHEDYQAAVASGMYLDLDLDEPSNGGTESKRERTDRARDKISGTDSLTGDNRHYFYECHVDLSSDYIDDLQDAPCRFIVTFDKSSEDILSVYRGWHEGDAEREAITMMTQYVYMHGVGPYGLGLVHMLGNSTLASTSALRQLIDAGTLANLPGGFKTRGLRIKNDSTAISPGEWRDVDVASGKLSDGFMPLPYKEPSQVLLALYNTIGEEARRFVATADLSVQDMPSNAGSMGMLGMLEKSAKYQSAIITRIFTAMCDELIRVKDILGDSDLVPDTPEYPDQASRADFHIAAIVPVADPNASSQAHRMGMLQAAQALVQTDGSGIVNQRELYLEGFRIIGLEQPERFINPDPSKQQPPPMDPVSENMAIMTGKPVLVQAAQDHEAHIKSHQAFMQDPQIQQMLSASPMAQGITGAMDAHLREHVAYDYMRRVERSLGAPLPEQRDGMDATSAGLIAQASDMVLGKAQQRAAADQAAAASKDPVLQQQNAELALKEREVRAKEQKVAFDHMEKMIELQHEGAKLPEKVEGTKLDNFAKAQQITTGMQQETTGAAPVIGANNG